MTLSPAEQLELERLVEEQAADLEWLEQVDQQQPLASSVLWRNDDVPWDQRRAVIAAMTSPYTTIVKGGERSGKSLGPGKQLTLAQALGGDHPAVRSWLDLNDLPHAIPDGPGRVYASALDSNSSRRYHRPDFDLLVREGKHWYNQQGKGEAILLIRVPNYAKMAEIWFKAVDQGPDAYQGDSIRWWWIDEEPTTEKGRLVYRQCLARAMDQGGRGVITMVPMSGYTWVHDRLIIGGEDRTVVVTLNALDNPHLPRDGAADYFESMTDEERAIRQYGEFRSKSGVVYPEFIAGDGNREGMGHMCDDFDVPHDWPRYRGLDFGLVNPTCVLWGALGDDDTLYVYREYYVPNGKSYRWHADQVAPLEGMVRLDPEDEDSEWIPAEGDDAEIIQCGWGDPAGKVARVTFNDAGIETLPANNDMKGGLDRVRERLRRRGDGRPRLKIFRSCPNLLRELNGYLWDPNRKDEYPLKKDDHSCDAIRYMIQGIHAS